MKNKKIISLLILSFTLFIIPINTLANDNYENVSIESIDTSKNGETSTYANDIRWRYKIVNNILYRRQYDYTLRRWIGEWERVV